MSLPGGSPMRRSARVLLVLAVLAAVWAAPAAPAAARAPDRAGWWTATNPGMGDEEDEGGGEAQDEDGLAPPGSGSGGLGEVTHGDVPEGGFEVAGSAEQPSSVAALAYEIAPGAQVGALTLEIAQEAANAPGSEVHACALVEDAFEEAEGGPLREAPEWDCSDPALGEVDEDGAQITFEVGELAEDEGLAVAILPADGGSRLVFERPGTSSLEVTGSGLALDPDGGSGAGQEARAGDDSGEPPPTPRGGEATGESSVEGLRPRTGSAEPPDRPRGEQPPRAAGAAQEPAPRPTAEVGQEQVAAPAEAEATSPVVGTAPPSPSGAALAGALALVAVALLLGLRARRAVLTARGPAADV